MSDPIEIDGSVTIAEITKLLEFLGATIVWSEPELMPTALDVECVVDPVDAWNALPGWMKDRDFEDAEQDVADPRDLHDFLHACVAGDRPMALALAPRLFVEEANLAVIERDLFRGGLVQ